MTAMYQTIDRKSTGSAFGDYLQQHGKPELYKRLLQRQGLNASTIEKWMAGTSRPAPWLQVEICRALNCRRDRLWPAERPPDHDQPVYDIHRRNSHSPLIVTRIDKANR